MIETTGEGKSAVATPDGKSRKKKKNYCYRESRMDIDSSSRDSTRYNRTFTIHSQLPTSQTYRLGDTNLFILPPTNDLIQAVECTRRHKQDVGGVNRNALPAKFTRAAFRHIDGGAL